MKFYHDDIHEMEWKKIRKNKKVYFPPGCCEPYFCDYYKKIKICDCCGTEMVLVEDETEFELIEELGEKRTLSIPFEIVAGTKCYAYKKLEKLKRYADYTDLPIRGSYAVTEFETEFDVGKKKKYRLSGTIDYKATRAYSKGSLPALNGICPCCGQKRDALHKKYVEQQCEEDYVKLTKKYKKKTKKENIEIDYSEFDFKEYLGTLIELHKEAFILEEQIRLFLKRKHMCKCDLLKIKGLFIFENKKFFLKEYSAAQKRFSELCDKKIEDIQLPSKNSAWENLIGKTEEDIYCADFEKPEKPIAPQMPTKPQRPKKIYFDKSRLVKPVEPVYGVGNFFTKKRIERENELLRKNYEDSLARYIEACDEFVNIKQQQKKLEERYKSECDTFDDLMQEFEKAMSKYNVRLGEYEKKIKEYEIPKEKRQLTAYLCVCEQEKKKMEAEIEALPEVISRVTAETFLEDEIAIMIEDLFNIYEAIDELNSLNVVYEKYNQFHILCNIYEYFLAGRVSGLTGPHGAYNLYEREVKTDKILKKLDDIDGKLEVIINQLEDIKESQTVLYQIMTSITESIKCLGDSMEKLSSEIASVNSSNFSSGLYRDSLSSLPSYSDYHTVRSSQHSAFERTTKRASVVKSGIIGGVLAGPAGAIVGALSAADKNMEYYHKRRFQNFTISWMFFNIIKIKEDVVMRKTDFEICRDKTNNTVLMWKKSRGIASENVANKMDDAMLIWLVSLTDTLKIWIDKGVNMTDGELILARVNIGALVESWMKFFYCAYYEEYLQNPLCRNNKIIEPNNMKFEDLKKFSVKILFEDEQNELYLWIDKIQHYRNSIHAFNYRDIGTPKEFLEDVKEYYRYVDEILCKIPPIEDFIEHYPEEYVRNVYFD